MGILKRSTKHNKALGKTALTQEFKDQARAGDALLKFILAEFSIKNIRYNRAQLFIMQGNLFLSNVVINIGFKDSANPWVNATFIEAYIYRLYCKFGIESARNFIINEIIEFEPYAKRKEQSP
jgi:hypothetical protein